MVEKGQPKKNAGPQRLEEQDTIPLPALNFHHLPSIRELREYCGLSYFQLAYDAQVRPRVVYWLEQGIPVTRQDACRILYALSCKTAEVATTPNAVCKDPSARTCRIYTLANTQPIRLKADPIPLKPERSNPHE